MPNATKQGKCPSCLKGPRRIPHIHPVSKINVCRNCYKKARKNGHGLTVCTKCNKEITGIPCRHPVTKKEICQSCYRRAGLNSAIFRPRREEERRDGNKCGRKAKYPTRESLIALLEQRESRGEENFPSSIISESSYLYILFCRAGIELPRKNRPQIEYCPGDKVENVNFRDRSVCGKIGTVISNGGKEVLVTFGEPSGIKRVYKKWYNLNNIVLYNRNSKRLAEKPAKNKSPAC